MTCSAEEQEGQRTGGDLTLILNIKKVSQGTEISSDKPIITETLIIALRLPQEGPDGTLELASLGAFWW